MSIKPRDRGLFLIVIGDRQQILLWCSQRSQSVERCEGYLALLMDVCAPKENRLSIWRAGKGRLSVPLSQGKTLAKNSESNGNDVAVHLDESVQVQDEQVVEFRELGGVVSERTEPSSVRGYEGAVVDRLENSVKGFLERPIAVTYFDWKSVGLGGANLWTMDLPEAWLKRTMVAEKLTGFRYLRCNFRVRVQVNAQPFNAGLLMLWFRPLAQQCQYEESNAGHFGGVTGYRHVVLDIATDTAAELVIPYVANVSHRDLTDGVGVLGRVFLTVYSPLTGSADVDGTIWLTAEDVDVQMPTTVPLLGVDEMDGSGAGSRDGVVSGVVRRVGQGVQNVAAYISWFTDALAESAEMFGFSKPVRMSDDQAVYLGYAANMTNFNGVSPAKVLALDHRNCIDNTIVSDTMEDEMEIQHLLRKWIYTDRFLFSETKPQTSVLWRWPVSPLSCIKNKVTVSPTPGRQIVRKYELSTMLSYIGHMFEYWRGGIEYKFRIVKTAFHSGRIRVTYIPGAAQSMDVGTVDTSKIMSKIVDLRDTHEFEFVVPFVSQMPWRHGSRASGVDDLALSDAACTGMIYVDVLNALRRPATAADTIEIVVESRAAPDFEYALPRMDPGLHILYNDAVGSFQAMKSEEKVEVLSGKGSVREKAKAEEKSDVVSVPVGAKLRVTGGGPNDALGLAETMTEEKLKAMIASKTFFAVTDKMRKDLYYVAKRHDSKVQWATWIKVFVVIGVDEMNESNFVRDGQRTGPEAAAVSMGERIVSLRQILKRMNRVEIPFPKTELTKEIMWAPTATNWDLSYTESHTDTYTGWFDWITGLYRWRRGSMRVGFAPVSGVDRADVDTPMSIRLIPTSELTSGSRTQVIERGKQWRGGANVLFFSKLEEFMEVNVPFYQGVPAIPSRLGAPLNSGGDRKNVVPSNLGVGLALTCPVQLEAWRSIGEDFSFMYAVGPPIVYVDNTGVRDKSKKERLEMAEKDAEAVKDEEEKKKVVAFLKVILG